MVSTNYGSGSGKSCLSTVSLITFRYIRAKTIAFRHPPPIHAIAPPPYSSTFRCCNFAAVISPLRRIIVYNYLTIKSNPPPRPPQPPPCRVLELRISKGWSEKPSRGGNVRARKVKALCITVRTRRERPSNHKERRVEKDFHSFFALSRLAFCKARNRAADCRAALNRAR